MIQFMPNWWMLIYNFIIINLMLMMKMNYYNYMINMTMLKQMMFNKW